MSTAINDLSAGVTCVPAVVPDTYTETTAGAALDMISGDGAGFAILAVGAVSGDTQVAGYVEESDDDESWSETPLESFPATGANAVRVISFHRSARYVRATLAVTGSSPQADAAIVVGQRKKTA